VSSLLALADVDWLEQVQTCRTPGAIGTFTSSKPHRDNHDRVKPILPTLQHIYLQQVKITTNSPSQVACVGVVSHIHSQVKWLYGSNNCTISSLRIERNGLTGGFKTLTRESGENRV